MISGMIGQILDGRYKIINPLGGGTFGKTYLAQDTKKPSQPRCVVKWLQPQLDPKLLLEKPKLLTKIKEFFEQEAVILEKLGEHSQIPQLLAHFMGEQGELFIVQEWVDGQDLSQEIIPGRQLSEGYVIKLLWEVLEVLAFVHQHQVIHCDIKPANLMRRKQSGKIVLIDFGGVKQLGTLSVNPQGEVKTTIVLGTPGYSPAEQAKGKPRLSSDIYAVGMVAIQALTGIPPYLLPEDPKTGEAIWRNQAQVNHALAEFLTNMVRDHFSQRYATATEALQRLNTISPGGPPPVIVSPVVTPLPSQPLEKTIAVFSPASPAESPIEQIPQQIFQPSPSPHPKTPSPPPPSLSLGNGITLELVNIPGGRFKMGGNEYDDEKPIHPVTVPAFQMGKYPITQEQYQAVMGKNPSHFNGAKCPVERVSWNDAVAFCQRLSQTSGRTVRLPSEAEWEYACRAGSDTKWCFGNNENELENHAWYSANSNSETHPVGEKKPNAWGLYDMHGNVWEWCGDDWHDSYTDKPETLKQNGLLIWLSSDVTANLLRGGSWDALARNCRSANRFRNRRDDGITDVGFRVCCSFSRTS